MSSKAINDTIHGVIHVDGACRDLLSTPEFNKLSHIKQLGLAHLVFPGAHHTRFEHSLGVSHLGGKMADSVGLDAEEKKLVETAAMLHDVGHGPYSHTLEHILHARGGMDHMSVTEGIITGDYDVLRGDEHARVGFELPVGRKRHPECFEIVRRDCSIGHHCTTLTLDFGFLLFFRGAYTAARKPERNGRLLRCLTIWSK